MNAKVSGIGLIRRITAALAVAALLASGMPAGAPALAEEEMTEQDAEELAAAEGEDTEETVPADPNAIYHEKTLEDFTVNSPALYRGKFTDVVGEYSIYS